jgi:hypothetical protein
MKTIQIISTIVLFCSFAFQSEAKKVKLQYQLKAGDQFKLEMNISQDIVQESSGQSQNSKSFKSNTYEFKVTNVSQSGDMELNAVQVAFAIESSGVQFGDMKYNSSSGAAVPDFAKDQAAVLNEIYSFTLSPLGKITNIKIPEGILEKIKKIMEDSGAGKLGFDTDEAGKAFDEQGFGRILNLFFMTFPAGEAEADVPWEVETEGNPRLMLSKFVSNYSLTKSSGDINEIRVMAKISPDNMIPPKERFGMKFSFDFTGDKMGTLLLDPLTGLIRNAEAITSLQGAMVINSPQMQAPTKIPMTMRATERVITKL